MKPMYPQILAWLAGKTGTPDHAAHRLWRKALRDATAECAVIESPEYWQSAVEHLRASFPSISPAAAVSSGPAASTNLTARDRWQMA
ncbi:MAG: hypothetical protein AW09_003453 [Candidatus Accumulibacter phosphatis]|uniref:Uncharacterized protein n=1 Tax=Candidatus Accumulibacter phosphatis TaxID=327160 RepID=A0A080LUT3_9PROT|nr:MAG: hypothetical protein AW09_003453 [Candidatus Accumulibacter phosphatis]